MERKIEFVRRFATHTEPAEEGIAVVVSAETYEGSAWKEYYRRGVAYSVSGPAVFCTVTIRAWQGGSIISEREFGGVLVLPKPSKCYFKSMSLTVGSKVFVVGFSGKNGSIRRGGWFPKFLHVKIESI